MFTNDGGIRVFLRIRPSGVVPTATAQPPQPPAPPAAQVAHHVDPTEQQRPLEQQPSIVTPPTPSATLAAPPPQQDEFIIERNNHRHYETILFPRMVESGTRDPNLGNRSLAFMLQSELAQRRVVDNSIQMYRFNFRQVFDANATQQEVYNAVALPAVTDALDGFNATIFAYGQTGSGKTHSTTGPPVAGNLSQQGYLPRSLHFLFEEVHRREQQYGLRYTIRVSYMQIYNDVGQDLLNRGRDCDRMEQLPIVSVQLPPHSKAPVFENLECRPVTSASQALRCLTLGQSNRRTCETPLNKSSSRSHCIFTVWIEARGGGAPTTTTEPLAVQAEEDAMFEAAGLRNPLHDPRQIQQQPVVMNTKIHFVDLAGSERLTRTIAVGSPFALGQTVATESRYINLSLHYLEQVIIALGRNAMQAAGNRPAREGQDFVPYRNSFLTMALRDALGGDNRTVMLATVHPHAEMRAETISTCQFSMRVGLVRQGLTKADSQDPDEIIRKLRRENAELKAALKASETKLLPRLDRDQQQAVQQTVTALLQQPTTTTGKSQPAGAGAAPSEFLFAKRLGGNFSLALWSLLLLKKRYVALHTQLDRRSKNNLNNNNKVSKTESGANDDALKDDDTTAEPTTAADDIVDMMPEEPVVAVVECHLCCNTFDADSGALFECCEGHRMCRDCFSQYVLVTWSDKAPLLLENALAAAASAARDEDDAQQQGESRVLRQKPKTVLPQLNCPFKDCSHPPLRDAVVGLYVDEAAFERYLEIRQSARDAQMLADTQARIALVVTAEQQRELDTQFLREQLVRIVPGALMCPNCACGPIDLKGCDDLAAHHGQHLEGGVSYQNKCPNCGFFAARRDQWLPWDGSAPSSNKLSSEAQSELEEAQEYELARLELQRLREGRVSTEKQE